MNQGSVQDRLFAFIKEKLSPEESVAEAISELLHVSTDSAYRRIRGETPLVFDELITICKQYDLSIDDLLFRNQKMVLFENTRIDLKTYNYERYLSDLKKQIDILRACDQKELIYMSKDLPIFYNFYFKPLIAFRYFFWMKIQLQDPAFANAKFDMDLLPAQIEKLSYELIKNYNEIPSTEIWNIESINSTISQIEFSRTSGHFHSPGNVIAIYDALESSIRHLQDQVEYGGKFLPGESPSIYPRNLKFFFNRIALGDNTVLIKANQLKTVFINYGNLNYLATFDDNFCKSLFEDFENIKKRSTLISITGERQRNVFFNILLSKIRERKQNAG